MKKASALKKGYSKKPANQGSAGKPNYQKPMTAKKASSKGGKVFQTAQPSGTRGSKNK
jgi:hypothetical protein